MTELNMALRCTLFGVIALCGVAITPNLANAGVTDQGSTVLVADFDGDSRPEAMVVTKQGSAMLCGGSAFANCRMVSVPSARAYFALYEEAGRPSELLALGGMRSSSTVCHLEGGGFASSCVVHSSSNVGAYSQKETSRGESAALVVETTTGTQVCEWGEGAFSCRTSQSRAYEHAGVRYLAGQFSKIGASEVLLIDDHGGSLCSFDVGAASSRCNKIAASTSLGIGDVQAGSLLQKGRTGLLLFTAGTASICRVDAAPRAASLACYPIGPIVENVSLSIGPSRGSALETVTVVQEGDAARASAKQAESGVRDALKAVRAGSSMQQKIEEFDDAFSFPPIEVIGWPEPLDTHWDLPEPSPWFDGGYPPQIDNEVDIVSAGAGGLSAVEMCKKVCDRVSQAAHKACSRFRNPVVAQICHVAENVRYAACLRECESP